MQKAPSQQSSNISDDEAMTDNCEQRETMKSDEESHQFTSSKHTNEVNK